MSLGDDLADRDLYGTELSDGGLRIFLKEGRTVTRADRDVEHVLEQTEAAVKIMRRRYPDRNREYQ